ncbi:MAG TPA: TIGR00282 family metallophosphoesterase [Bacillota bacterium]|nr:TIGR00282 family metallophosphoesterase [Bacillota bacterium]
MNILYIGDIMGEPGIQMLEKVLPDLRKQHNVDFVVAQAENLSDGKGIRVDDFRRLQRSGVDFCTGGNHSFYREEINPLLDDPKEPIIRPANYPTGTPGLGYKAVETPKGRVLVVSLLGQIVGKDASLALDNPLKTIDNILAENRTPRVATIVNFHGDFSSEKRIIGYYLDGRATLVVGDHWHVPTNDASVLPKGTAHQSDVGMVGSLDSSLGVRFDTLIPRWRDNMITKNILETTGRMQFNALLVQADDTTGLATSAKAIQIIHPA